MKIIVLNCGSSSIKFQLFDMTTHIVMAKGVVEKIGLHGSFLKYERHDGDKTMLEGEILDHQTGIEYMLGLLSSKKHGVLTNFNEIEAVGHRVVMGGEEFVKSAFIDDHVIQVIENVAALAPLHNPANLKGIYAMKSLLPDAPQVVTFDTAFHQTMPEKAYMYAIPYALYKKYGIRRYGFHGTSHLYVSRRACEVLKKDFNKQKIITCHLGNGASIAAIKDGKSVDTSMGLTPLEGLIMGTRCGDIDAGAITYLMRREEMHSSTLDSLLNKHSGMLGVSGISSDMREIQEAAFEQKNERALLSIDMYVYRIKKYIGAYTAAMGGVDIVVFTGGIGENAFKIRAAVCKDMEFLGMDFDPEANFEVRAVEQQISKPNSRVKLMIIPTNEELVIAQDTEMIVKQLKK
jgi:acetate kinase